MSDISNLVTAIEGCNTPLLKRWKAIADRMREDAKKSEWTRQFYAEHGVVFGDEELA